MSQLRLDRGEVDLPQRLANARSHTPEGTTVTVGVTPRGDEVLLTVTTTGPASRQN